MEKSDFPMLPWIVMEKGVGGIVRSSLRYRVTSQVCVPM